MKREDGWLHYRAQLDSGPGPVDSLGIVIKGPPTPACGPRVVVLIEETPGELDGLHFFSWPSWAAPPAICVDATLIPPSEGPPPAGPEPEPPASPPGWRDLPPML